MIRHSAACAELGVLIMTLGLASAVAAAETAPSRLALDASRSGVPVAMAFSPDGQSLAVVGMTSPARTTARLVSLWDAATGHRKWQQPTGPSAATTTTVAFSPDGQLLAVPAGLPVSTVALLDIRSGKPRTMIKIGQSPGSVEFRMSFSADGKQLAGCVPALLSPYALRLWQSAGGRPISEMKLPLVPPDAKLDSPESLLGSIATPRIDLAFAPDGRVIAVTAAVRVELWEVPSGKLRAAVPLIELAPREGKTGIVMSGMVNGSLPWRAPLFSPDGKTLVAAAVMDRDANNPPSALPREGEIYLIDVQTGRKRQVVEKFPNRFLAFQADGKSVVGAASRGGRLRLALCSMETCRVKSVLDHEVSSRKAIEEIAFSRDGSKLAMIERNLVNSMLQFDAYSVRVWDASTGKQLAEVDGLAQAGSRAGQTRADKTSAAGRRLTDARSNPSGKRSGTRPPVGAGVSGLVWGDNARGPVAQGEYEASAGPLSPRLLFSPDGRRLAVLNAAYTDDATIDLWTLTGPITPGDTPAAAPLSQGNSSPEEPKQKAELRTWTSDDGNFTIDAQLVKVDGDAIILKKKGGKEMKVPLAKLSAEDREYVGKARH